MPPSGVQAQWVGPYLTPPEFPPAPVSVSEFPVATGYFTPVPTFAPVAANTNVAGRGGAWRGNNSAQAKYTIDLLEDRSGSLADFFEAGGGSPMEIADSRTVQAMLRVLGKQDLIEWQSRPRLMANVGETASFHIGTESPESQSFTGLTGEITGRELGGGMAVIFTMRQSVNGKESKVSLDTVIPTGQCAILKAGSRPATKPINSEATATDDPATGETQNAVYIVLTPEIVR
jgi:hypothetical protein